METVYCPGASPGKLYVPSACVCAVLGAPLPESVMAAAGITAPESSVSTPLRMPVVDCAKAHTVRIRARDSNKSRVRIINRFATTLHFEGRSVTAEGYRRAVKNC